MRLNITFTIMTLLALSLQFSIPLSPSHQHPAPRRTAIDGPLLRQRHLQQVFNLFVRLQKKRYRSVSELKYRMRVFKKNLHRFIRPEDDVLQRIRVEKGAERGPKIEIIPDKRLSVDFNFDGEDDDFGKSIFELNKFSDLTDAEFDNLYLLDQSYFDSSKHPVEGQVPDSSSGIESIQKYISSLEEHGVPLDPALKNRYFNLNSPENSSSNTTPHFSTLGGASVDERATRPSPTSCESVTHRNAFWDRHPRLLVQGHSGRISSNQFTISIDGVMVPTIVDWRQMGATTPIKDQLKCNACYAFSALAAVEAHYKIISGKTVSLAEQEIVDCSRQNNGCTGGLPHLVFNYIRSNDISYTKNYNYDERRNAPCRLKLFKEKFPGYHVKGFINIRKGVLSLIKALSKGPVATISYASREFKQYGGGLYRGQGCQKRNKPNHSSLLIGYNLTGKRKYLIFKNGWGTDWGNQGYYTVELGDLRSSNLGHCMIAATIYNSLPKL